MQTPLLHTNVTLLRDTLPRSLVVVECLVGDSLVLLLEHLDDVRDLIESDWVDMGHGDDGKLVIINK